MPALHFSNRLPRGPADGEAVHKRYKNGTNWGLKGNAAAVNRGKVSNISNFCGNCCGDFFVPAQFCPQRPLIPEKKLSKIELKRPVAPKNRGILATWSLQLLRFPKVR